MQGAVYSIKKIEVWLNVNLDITKNRSLTKYESQYYKTRSLTKYKSPYNKKRSLTEWKCPSYKNKVWISVNHSVTKNRSLTKSKERNSDECKYLYYKKRGGWGSQGKPRLDGKIS